MQIDLLDLLDFLKKKVELKEELFEDLYKI